MYVFKLDITLDFGERYCQQFVEVGGVGVLISKYFIFLLIFLKYEDLLFFSFDDMANWTLTKYCSIGLIKWPDTITMEIPIGVFADIFLD